MVKNAMGSMYYCKCIVCKKRERNCKAQLEVMKKRYSRSVNWHYMRFNNEFHFEYDLQSKLRIICKSDK